MHSLTCYRFKDPAEIYELAHRLSQFFPEDRNVLPGIYELLLNSVEHGNLEIDKSQKALLLEEGRFIEEIARRLALPENAEKYVEIDVSEDDSFCILTIRDQGRGFDWRKYLLNSTADLRAPYGRGLLIAMHCGFDELTFNTAGNSVICKMKIHGMELPLRSSMKRDAA